MQLLNLFLQSNCPLCERPTSQDFCLDCSRQLERCKLPKHEWLSADVPVFAWGLYGGILKRAIAVLKFENKPDLARPLGYWLAQAWLNSQLPATNSLIVVPIPLHVNKLQQRGFNQAALLAQSFCNMTGLKLQHYGLERVQQTEALFGLSALEREKKLAKAFGLGSGFRRHHPTNSVLLLDDIYTTGATAFSAAQTLRDLDISVYGLVAIATSQKNKQN